MCDGHLSAKEQRRLMDDCDRWAQRAERAEAENKRLQHALYRACAEVEALNHYANFEE